MAPRFTSRHRGNRCSIGYAACPNLEIQAELWKLLKPGSIGVRLTEGFMMNPEANLTVHEDYHRR
jgi:5-methyltetrahydrofolate--homocysteine methyltransferase